jgi:hypothetical protein
MKLLYRTAEWHGFAKLRLHTDSTLKHLQSLTKEFGRLMREFRDQTCSQFQTFELQREVDARNRNQQRRLANTSSVVTPSQTRTSSASAGGHRANTLRPATSTGTQANVRKAKTLNISTTKFHFLGDYVHTIQMFGCTDSYSTQLV